MQSKGDLYIDGEHIGKATWIEEIITPLTAKQFEQLSKALNKVQTVSIQTTYSFSNWRKLLNVVLGNPRRRHYLRRIARRQGNDWIHIKKETI